MFNRYGVKNGSKIFRNFLGIVSSLEAFKLHISKTTTTTHFQNKHYILYTRKKDITGDLVKCHQEIPIT